jgi:hypothetical protein
VLRQIFWIIFTLCFRWSPPIFVDDELPGSGGSSAPAASLEQSSAPAAYPGHSSAPVAYPGHGSAPTAFPGHSKAPAASPGRSSAPAASPSQSSAPAAYPGQSSAPAASSWQSSAPGASPGQSSAPAAYPGQSSAPAAAYPGQSSAPAAAYPRQSSAPAACPGQSSAPAAFPGQSSAPAVYPGESSPLVGSPDPAAVIGAFDDTDSTSSRDGRRISESFAESNTHNEPEKLRISPRVSSDPELTDNNSVPEDANEKDVADEPSPPKLGIDYCDESAEIVNKTDSAEYRKGTKEEPDHIRNPQAQFSGDGKKYIAKVPSGASSLTTSAEHIPDRSESSETSVPPVGPSTPRARNDHAFTSSSLFRNVLVDPAAEDDDGVRVLPAMDVKHTLPRYVLVPTTGEISEAATASAAGLCDDKDVRSDAKTTSSVAASIASNDTSHEGATSGAVKVTSAPGPPDLFAPQMSLPEDFPAAEGGLLAEGTVPEFTCDICTKGFAAITDLSEHKRSDHRVYNVSDEETPESISGWNLDSSSLVTGIEQCCGSGIRCLFDPWIRDPE